MTKLGWVALGSLALAACTQPVPIESYGEEAIRANCRLLLECCEEGMRGGYATEEECVMDSPARLGALQEWVMQGKVDYDGVAARECFDGATCDLDAPPEACRRVISGRIADGEPCENSVECAGGFCNTLGGPEGICETLPGEGDPCELVCGAGLYCDSEDSMTCLPQKGAGAECTSASECRSVRCTEGTCADASAVLCRPPR